MPIPDQPFFDRADAHIQLSNEQTLQESAGKVSASMLFASARFAAFITARGHDSREIMKAKRDEDIAYFVDEYRKMLADNLDDYIENFDDYMKSKSDDNSE